jgi:selenocysteine lyase/cysteine desulfurase
LAPYNSADDVDRLVRALATVLERVV